MLRRHAHTLVLAATLGCGESPRVYPYVHMETTGLTTAVQVDGERVTIGWDPSSDAGAMAALGALRPETLLAAATYGRGLQLVGVLAPAVQHTAADPHGPASEPYRSFVLHDWYVVLPFRRFVPASEDPLDGVVPGPLAEHLEDADFGPLPDGRRVDPRRHEQAR